MLQQWWFKNTANLGGGGWPCLTLPNCFVKCCHVSKSCCCCCCLAAEEVFWQVSEDACSRAWKFKLKPFYTQTYIQPSCHFTGEGGKVCQHVCTLCQCTLPTCLLMCLIILYLFLCFLSFLPFTNPSCLATSVVSRSCAPLCFIGSGSVAFYALGEPWWEAPLRSTGKWHRQSPSNQAHSG